MQYRVLGRTGVKVAPLTLGTMNFGGRSDAAEAESILEFYTANGGNFIDTANIYNDGQSEKIIGQWLRSSDKRDKIVLSTKVRFKRSDHINDQGNHRWHIVREVENSLARLKTDRIDVYHIHRPDPDTPIDQTLRALDDLIRQGKVLYIASSTFAGWELAEAHFIAQQLGTARFDIEQPPLNILDRRCEAEAIPFCRKYDVAVIPWAPLARGRLTGTYTRGGRRFPDGTWYESQGKKDFPACQWPIMETVDQLADEHGITSSQFAIAWCMQVPGVTSPIIGPRTLDQLKDNMAAIDVTLSASSLETIDSLNPSGQLARDPSAGPIPR